MAEWASHQPIPCRLKTTSTDPFNGHIQRTDGWDIVFRHDNGSCEGGICAQLDHEIEKYDGTNGELIAWVRIPSISKSTNTDFYIYYGNGCIDIDPQNKTGVWDSTKGWRGVWHLHESGGDATDSTTYGSSGTLSGTVTQGASGQIDGGYDFGTDGKVDTGDQTHYEFGSNSFAVNLWVNVDQSTGADQVLQYKGGYGSGNAGYAFVTNSTASTVDFRVRDTSDNNAPSPAGSITLDTWMHLVGVVDRSGNKVRLYQNGTEIGTGTDISGVGTLDDSDSQVLAFSYGSANEMDGLLDEARIYAGIQTAD